jgi:hypothetical protein
MMRQFESDADVQQHFALLARSGSKPSPPADLWERIETARRAAERTHARKSYGLTEPDLTRLRFPKIKSEQKIHPIRLHEHIRAVPDVRPQRKKTYKLKGSADNRF